MKKFAIIGSGSWGTALGNHIAEMGHDVLIWSFAEEEKEMINNEHKCMFLPDVTLSDKLICSTNIEEVCKNADIILHVTPSKFTRSTFKTYKDFVGNKPVIICSKGFEDATLSTLDMVLKEEKPDIRVAALSGPTYATEVIQNVPTAIILASEDEEILNEVPELLSNEALRVYSSKDIRGVELGGSLKNIIAFCSGICVELGFGTNASSALITRGLAEIARLGVKMGARAETFYGLSGLGDLILTCSSDESRNRRAGRCIGRGLSIEETKKEVGATIESIDNIEIAKKLSDKYGVEMPIVNAAYDILYHGLSAKEAGKKLMTRSLKFE